MIQTNMTLLSCGKQEVLLHKLLHYFTCFLIMFVIQFFLQ